MRRPVGGFSQKRERRARYRAGRGWKRFLEINAKCELDLAVCPEPVEDAEAATQHRLGCSWTPRQTETWSECGLVVHSEGSIRRVQYARRRIEENIQVMSFAHRRVVLVTQTVIQSDVRPDFPLVLRVSDVVLQSSQTVSGCAVI